MGICCVIHPAEFSNIRDNNGCILDIGHHDQHEFVSEDGTTYQWEEEVCTDCDCDLDAGECCTTYWRKPVNQNIHQTKKETP